MPDWSYHTLFKPILSKVPSRTSREFIHKSMDAISRMPLGPSLIEFLGHLKADQYLKKEFFGLTFTNSIGLSATIDPYMSGTNAFINLGFGVTEIGPISLQDSNSSFSPLIDLKDNKIIGYEENKPLNPDYVINKLSKLNKNAPIFANVLGDYKEFKFIDSKLSNLVEMYIVNVELAHEISKNNWLHSKPLCVSIHPNELDSLFMLNKKDYDSIMIEEIQFSTNFEQKNYLIETIKLLKSRQIEKPIFTKGGVIEPIDAIELLNEGAALTFLTHGYVYSGPGLPKRINEALLFNSNQPVYYSNGWIWYYLFGLFMFIGGLLALIISLTTIILPYDEHFLKLSSKQISQFNSRILPFMSHDRMTLSGTIMSGGILFMSLAKHGIKHRYHWAKKAVDSSAIIGFLAIFLFIGFGYFDWLHGLFWLLLFPPFLVGFFMTKGLKRSPESHNLTNNQYWKTSLIGQLFFIILGFSIIFGGLIISYVGITTTFVKTDLEYLCITPSQINEFNRYLIPVISHDRAGFGGGLISVGLLVLMISLWGFRQGDKWIWWTLLFGSLPAFTSAFAVHFMIGYNDFYHLLPPIIATILLIIGLVKSNKFLHLIDK